MTAEVELRLWVEIVIRRRAGECLLLRRTWVPARLASGSYLGHSGKHMLVASLSQADPLRPFEMRERSLRNG